MQRRAASSSTLRLGCYGVDGRDEADRGTHSSAQADLLRASGAQVASEVHYDVPRTERCTPVPVQIGGGTRAKQRKDGAVTRAAGRIPEPAPLAQHPACVDNVPPKLEQNSQRSPSPWVGDPASATLDGGQIEEQMPVAIF